MSVTPFTRAALRWLLPAPCLGCGEPLPDSTPLGLCRGCHGTLTPWPRRAACRRCARPLAAAEIPAGYRCGPCRHRPPSAERLVVAWSFEGPLARVVKGFKFRRLDWLGEALGDAVVAAWTEGREPDSPLPDLVVPVPLPWTRRLRRGYNQADLLAVAVARRLGRPVERSLVRRPGRRQTRLARRERLRNLEGKLRCRRPLGGLRVLLIDDVTTTGATVEAAARCLLRAGAGAVEAAVVARTPAPIDRACSGALYSSSS